MKKGLVISWYFPPINSSEGLVTFKLLKNSKYKYDVFTQPEEFFTMVKEDIISNLRQYKDFLNAQEDSNLLMKLTRIIENNIALCIIDSIKKKGYEPNINNVKLCATFITCGMINVCRNCMNKFEQNIDRFIRDNTNLVLYGISGVFFGIKDNL